MVIVVPTGCSLVTLLTPARVRPLVKEGFQRANGQPGLSLMLAASFPASMVSILLRHQDYPQSPCQVQRGCLEPLIKYNMPPTPPTTASNPLPP